VVAGWLVVVVVVSVVVSVVVGKKISSVVDVSCSVVEVSGTEVVVVVTGSGTVVVVEVVEVCGGV